MAGGASCGAKTLSIGNSVSYAVRRAHGLLHLRLTVAFEHKQITFLQWAILVYLADGVAHTAADLSRCLNRDSGSLTRLVDQLEAQKLVKRRPSAIDRRVHEIDITPEGRATTRALTPAVTKVYDDVLSGLSQAEVETLLDLLHRIMAGTAALTGQSHGSGRRAEP